MRGGTHLDERRIEAIDDHLGVSCGPQHEIPVAGGDAANHGAELEPKRRTPLSNRTERDVSDLYILVAFYLREGALTVVARCLLHGGSP